MGLLSHANQIRVDTSDLEKKNLSKVYHRKKLKMYLIP